MPRFFIEHVDTESKSLVITGRDAEHIKVLRMRPGEALTVCNGKGIDMHCTLTGSDGKTAYADVLEVVPSKSEASVKVRIYAGLAKGDRVDYVAQKCTEMGAEEIVFFNCDRCVVRLDPKKCADKKVERWQRIAEEAFLHMLDFIKPGLTEREIGLELDYFMLKNGAEALSFETIAVSGPNTSLPHGVPGDRRVEEGDFITMDFGAVYDGYHSDMTRTVALGYATDEMIRVYDTVYTAAQKAIDAVKAGVKAADVDLQARNHIEKAGYGKYFNHGTGHGVGIEIHEAPTVSFRAGDTLLEEGNIITIEPGIYMPGKFGVRIEDMLEVTADGYVNLTAAEKKLIIIKSK